jgi:hypothetical protein
MKYVVIIFAFIGLLMSSCEEVDQLGAGFEVRYVDLEIYRNIYYNHQGIFHRLSVNEVKYDLKNILVGGYAIIENGKVDTSAMVYYFINKEKYKEDPSQMESKAVTGPFNKFKYEQLLTQLSYPRTLNWRK